MTKRIAVVTELLWSLRWHYDMAAGVQQYAAKMGLEWKIDVLPHPEILVEQDLASYDGAVGRLTPECVSGLGDIPMVNTWVASPVRRPGIPNVFVDTAAASGLAVRHLLSNGVQRFAHLSIHTGPAIEMSYQGVMTELTEKGYVCTPVYVDPGYEESSEQWRTLLNQILALIEEGDRLGLIVTDTRLARSCVSICQAAGLAVPHDFAVVSCENSQLVAQGIAPSITAVDLGHQRNDFEAARVLHQLIEGGACPSEDLFTPPKALLIGQSSDLHNAGNGIVEDTTRRLQARKELETLRAQLYQAQKMESIGRLAGGVAHDYNNMVSVILGCMKLALQESSTTDSLRQLIETAKEAAERSAELTRQLLAFSRQKVASPEVLDLNEVVAGTMKILKLLVSVDIELDWSGAEGLWEVRADAGQISQVLINLCTNARDAIDGKGRIRIWTENESLDEKHCGGCGEVVSGDFVILAVQDDGHGMDVESQRQLFEPFFTTKDSGHGVGLGLSIVHGIVKQNGGHIEVSSEPGKGATFRIFLPRAIAGA